MEIQSSGPAVIMFTWRNRLRPEIKQSKSSKDASEMCKVNVEIRLEMLVHCSRMRTFRVSYGG